MKRFHKLTAWLLTLAMLMTFIPSFTLTASAATVTASKPTAGDGSADNPYQITTSGGTEMVSAKRKQICLCQAYE